MPRRLLLAAEIIADVVQTSSEQERTRLLAAAENLRSLADEIGERSGLEMNYSPQMERLRPAIRRLAAAFDPEIESGADRMI
jgi:hypothetical protein